MPGPQGLPLGPLRFFSPFLAGQIGWLLPLAALGGLVAWTQTRARLPLDRRHVALTIWGGWFLTAAAFFSVANGFTMMHRYYLAMLAPPTAALVGIGLVAMWRDYRHPGWRGWLLPAGIAGTAALAAKILADYPDWSVRLTPVVLVLGLGSALGLVVVRLGQRGRAGFGRRALPAIALAGLVAILTAPAVWAGLTTWNAATEGGMPGAGPRTANGFGFGFGSPPGAFGPESAEARGTAGEAVDLAEMFGRGFGARTDPKLVAFLESHHDGQRFLFATTDANSAAPYVIATGQGVAALGGFAGGDPIVTPEGLAAMIARGEVRYFYVPSTTTTTNQPGAAETDAPNAGPGGFGPFGGLSRNANVQWINAHCAPVPTDQWRSSTSGASELFGRMNSLFDCKNAA
jgi:4-amino-4-deoxy-L-arabinose transferase-like glycosyltransferase